MPTALHRRPARGARAVLYEQVLEQLARDRVPGQRLLTPVVIELPAGPREALLAHRDELERLATRSASSGGECARLGRASLARTSEATVAVRALADDLEGLDRASRVEDASSGLPPPPPPRGGEGQLQARSREDALHPRRTAAHGLLLGLSARASRRAAHHASRSREELSSGSEPCCVTRLASEEGRHRMTVPVQLHASS